MAPPACSLEVVGAAEGEAAQDECEPPVLAAALARVVDAAGLEKHAARLAEEELALEDVALLTEADFDALGLRLGPRRRLVQAVREAMVGQSARTPTAADLTRPPIERQRTLEQAQAQNARPASSQAAVPALHGDAVPDSLLCPVTQDLLREPVLTVDGHTYEYSAIRRWLESNSTSPVTGASLPSKTLVPNLAMRALVADWLQRNGRAALPPMPHIVQIDEVRRPTAAAPSQQQMAHLAQQQQQALRQQGAQVRQQQAQMIQAHPRAQGQAQMQAHARAQAQVPQQQRSQPMANARQVVHVHHHPQLQPMPIGGVQDAFTAAIPHLNAALAADPSLVDVLRSVTPGELESTASMIAAAASEPSALQAFSARVPNNSPAKAQLPHISVCVVQMQRRMMMSASGTSADLQMSAMLDLSMYGPSAAALFLPQRRAQQRPPSNRGVDAERVYHLHQAVHAGDVSATERLLDQQRNSGQNPAGDINAPYGANDDTAMHVAARMGHTRVLRLLLHTGGDTERRSRNNSTPLHYACWTGHVEVVDALLECGASVSARMEGGDTPLHQAVWKRQALIVDRLLAYAARGGDTGEAFEPESDAARAAIKEVVNLRKQDGSTALHLCATVGVADIAESLLGAGADRNVTESIFKRTPLHLSALSGADAVMALLLDGPSVDPNVRCASDITPLHLTALNGHEQAATTLIEAGADVTLCDAAGNTALHLAASKGHTGLLRRLLGADAQVGGSKRPDKATPLHLAAARGAAATLRELLSVSTTPDVRNDNGATPLHYAALHGHEICAVRLVSGGASVNAETNNMGDTPLQMATFRNRHAVAMRLIESGANVQHKRRGDGATALHLAAMHGSADVATLLLESGADALATDQGGVTAAAVAAQCGHADLARVIRRAASVAAE